MKNIKIMILISSSFFFNELFSSNEAQRDKMIEEALEEINYRTYKLEQKLDVKKTAIEDLKQNAMRVFALQGSSSRQKSELVFKSIANLHDFTDEFFEKKIDSSKRLELIDKYSKSFVEDFLRIEEIKKREQMLELAVCFNSLQHYNQEKKQNPVVSQSCSPIKQKMMTNSQKRSVARALNNPST
jgi:hypothetical protein